MKELCGLLTSGPGGGRGFKLAQDSSQIADLTVDHGWAHREAGHHQPPDGYSDGYGDQLGQASGLQCSQRADAVGHRIESHDPAPYIIRDHHL